MNLKDFINEMHFIFEEQVRTRLPLYKQFILALNEEKSLYYFSIETTSPQNPFVQGVNDDYYLSHLESFIRKVLNDSKHMGKIHLPFNIAEKLSQDIIVYMQPCLKSLNFIYLNTDLEKIYQKDLNAKWREKILYIISTYGGGITLSQLIASTRGIRNNNIRKQYLRELVQENKIEMFQSGRYSKRPKTFYRIKTNENITPDNSGPAYSEAAGAEGQTGMV